MTETARNSMSLVFWIGICLMAGALGSVATAESVNGWYRTLSKPSWTPPGWVFGPVWTTLYVLMGIAAWLVWRAGWPQARSALSLFAVQLALNAGWSFLFFGFRLPGVAFAEIALLWAAILATLVAFLRHNRAAALLLAPYLAWVSFAGILNFSIWRMNV